MSNKQGHLRHLGLVLDGNRRWAKENGLTSYDGHKKGYENLKDIVKEAINSGIEYISAYIFSVENWNRSQEEVKYLMDLALFITKNEVRQLHKENIKVVFLGTEDRLDDKVIKAIKKAEDLTRNNTRGTVALCFNYGGQQEIADAASKLAKQGKANITPEDIEQNLYSPEVPPIDLIIRTSGEQRLSGFMLWRASYSELMFADKYWPDFNKDDLHSAINKYKNRERRFGK